MASKFNTLEADRCLVYFGGTQIWKAYPYEVDQWLDTHNGITPLFQDGETALLGISYLEPGPDETFKKVTTKIEVRVYFSSFSGGNFVYSYENV